MASDKTCRFTRHARDQMQRRGISPAAVRYVLAHYHTQRPAQPRVSARPAAIYTGNYHGRALRVYVEIDSSPPLVKTAAWETWDREGPP